MTTIQSNTLDTLKTRAAHLLKTSDGGSSFTGELGEFVQDLESLSDKDGGIGELADRADRYGLEIHRRLVDGDEFEYELVSKRLTAEGVADVLDMIVEGYKRRSSNGGDEPQGREVHDPRPAATPPQADYMLDRHYILLNGIITTARRLFNEINEPAKGEGLNRRASDLSCALDTQVDRLEAEVRRALEGGEA